MASVTLTLSSVRNKKTGKSEVLLRYRNTRKVALRAHTHVFLLPKFFADGEIIIKNRVITPEVREAQEAKAEVERIVTHIIDEGNKKPVDDFTQDWAQDTIDRFLYPENYNLPKNEELDILDKSADFMKYKKFSAKRAETYTTIFRTIQRYELYTGKKILIDQATAETLSNYEDFLRTEHDFFEPSKKSTGPSYKPVQRYKYVWDNSTHERTPRKRSDNCIINYMQAVKAYWTWLVDMDYTRNDPFKKYTIGFQKYGTPFYLTIEERDKFYKTKFVGDKELKLVRDIFVFQCYAGCRISDLFALTQDNLVTSEKGTAISYIPIKTKNARPKVVKVYLAPTALEIVNRHKSSSRKTLFPLIHTGKLNELLRVALKEAGIDRVVTVINPLTRQSEQHPICDVASSHMARRTFIGNLYKKVKDPNLVGKLSGHCEGSRAFARYRNIDDDMIREMTDLLD